MGKLYGFLCHVYDAEKEDKLWQLYLHSETKLSYGAWKREVTKNG